MAHNEHVLLLRINEAAERLALSRAAVYRLIEAGELPLVKIGTASRIPTKALVAWAEARETAASQRVRARSST